MDDDDLRLLIAAGDTNAPIFPDEDEAIRPSFFLVAERLVASARFLPNVTLGDPNAVWDVGFVVLLSIAMVSSSRS